MKKILSIIVVVVSISFFGNESKAQVEQGSMLVDGYYGYSLSRSFWKSAEVSGALETNYSGFGPIGFRFNWFRC